MPRARLGDTDYESQVPTLLGGGAYTTNDAVGAMMTFSAIAKDTEAGGVALGVIVADKAGNAANLELIIFHTTFTATTDNLEFDLSDADLLNIIAVIPVDTHYQFKDNSISVGYGSYPLRSIDGNLYAQLRTIGTPTLAVGDLQVTLMVLGDVW